MKKVISVVLAGLVGLVGLAGIATAADEAKQKVVYHVNAVGKENLDLRVVMHGNGVSMVLLPDALEKVKGFKSANASPQMQATIDGLKDQGVQFKVCANTLKGREVDMDNDLYMVEQADIVRSGVAELGILQAQGYAYIKP